MINIIQKLIQYDLGTRSTHSIVVIILSVSLCIPGLPPFSTEMEESSTLTSILG